MQNVRWEEGREGGQARTSVGVAEDAPRVVSEIHFFKSVGVCHVEALNGVRQACQKGGREGGKKRRVSDNRTKIKQVGMGSVSIFLKTLAFRYVV